jgi:hypothetical protein
MDKKELLVQFGLICPSLIDAQRAVEAIAYLAETSPEHWAVLAETYRRYLMKGGQPYTKEQLVAADQYAYERGLTFKDVLNFHLSK